MLIDVESTLLEFLEVLEANGEGDRETDGGPERVTPSDPVPEAEHVLRVDSEGGGLLLVGGQSHKMLGDGRRVLGSLEEPRLGRGGVGDGLLGGESLRRDDEKRRFSVDLLEGLGQVGSIDVRHEMHFQSLRVRLQGLGDHQRSQVRATNANVDYVGHLLAGVSLPVTAQHLVGELLHVSQHGENIWHDVFSINDDRLSGLIS